jgi:hypothetical protein
MGRLGVRLEGYKKGHAKAKHLGAYLIISIITTRGHQSLTQTMAMMETKEQFQEYIDKTLNCKAKG